jgi:hypothetical protein
MGLLYFLIGFIVFLNIFSFANKKVFNKKLQPPFINAIGRWTMLSEYAFYSPNIANSYVMLLTTKDTSGSLNLIPTAVSSFEMQQKIFNLYHFIRQDTTLRDVLAHSVATYYMNVNPEIDNIQLSFFDYHLPKLSRYQQGERPELGDLFYFSEFTKRDVQPIIK